MRRFIGLFALVGLVLASCGGGATVGGELEPSGDVERAPADPGAPVRDVAAGLNDAGFGLWREQAIDDNLVFSPLSIGHALLMAQAAADDMTATAIDQALSLPDSPHEGWNTLDIAMAGSADDQDALTLAIADRIWPEAGLEPDQGWIDLLARLHGSSVESLDFGGDPEGSREVINAWVADQTDELIPELLPEGFIDESTVLVLTDAIYLKARWQTVFGKYGPVDGEFTLLDGSRIDASFLHELELFDRRGEGDGFVGAELPYVGGDYSMLLIVPDEGRFQEVRERLDQSMLDEIDARWTAGPYELFMPKWETTSNLDLLPWMTEIGAAPGSYPAISPDAFLGAAVHGADITVDEWGTVAAAATGLGFAESAAGEPEFTLEANRPFLYLIRHRPSGAVLFAGQVVDPMA